jgi:hypothetical protein
LQYNSKWPSFLYRLIIATQGHFAGLFERVWQDQAEHSELQRAREAPLQLEQQPAGRHVQQREES